MLRRVSLVAAKLQQLEAKKGFTGSAKPVGDKEDEGDKEGEGDKRVLTPTKGVCYGWFLLTHP